jgi:hypothetical protein
LEPKQKNFKNDIKIKSELKKFNIRHHMSILVAFEWHYFQELLTCDTVPLRSFMMCALQRQNNQGQLWSRLVKFGLYCTWLPTGAAYKIVTLLYSRNIGTEPSYCLALRRKKLLNSLVLQKLNVITQTSRNGLLTDYWR